MPPSHLPLRQSVPELADLTDEELDLALAPLRDPRTPVERTRAVNDDQDDQNDQNQPPRREPRP